ncbi:MAG: DUF4878 domain-containing protein [Treponema sp.]|jgi:hypothetical protein|nr:DUF4878 domain-containing protein [Treponema sp.]
MKRILFTVALISFALVIGFTILACGGGNSDSPSAVVKQFFTAVEKGDTKALEKSATSETVALLAMFGEKAKEGATSNGKIKSTAEEIDGDTAVVTITFENDETENIDLVKVDGKWKVSISK